MLVRVVCLTECLLSCHVTLACKYSLWSWCSSSWEDSVRKHGASVEESFLLLFGALFEKYLSENIFLLFVWVIIFHVVIMWLIKDAIWIVIAVWIFVSYSSGLTHGWVWVDTKSIIGSSWHYLTRLLTILSLASYQENSLVKSANYWYFWLSLLCCCYSGSWLSSSIKSIGCSWLSSWCLLHRVAQCIRRLALMLTLIRCAAALWRLHLLVLLLLSTILFRGIFTLMLVLRAWARSFLEKYLLALWLLSSCLILSHHTVAQRDGSISHDEGVVHSRWDGSNYCCFNAVLTIDLRSHSSLVLRCNSLSVGSIDVLCWFQSCTCISSPGSTWGILICHPGILFILLSQHELLCLLRMSPCQHFVSRLLMLLLLLNPVLLRIVLPLML